MQKFFISFFAGFIFLILSWSTPLLAQCEDGRYHDKIFSTGNSLVNLPSNITYGENLNYEGQNTQLRMRVFQPQDDPAVSRPLIILAHGGSFLEGAKESPDVLHMCLEFAERGFVTATISYRLGVSTIDSVSMLGAVVRGVQDAKAAVRYFYKDAQTDNEFRIDTNQIYMGGVSAGAFIGLHLAYMTDTAAIQPYMLDIINNMGGLEGESGNTGYSSNIKGVINLFGAIGDTTWIQPGAPPAVSMHGTNDGTVPFESDIIRVSGNDLMNVDGSASINVRMQNAGIDHEFHPFIGADHVPYPLFLLPGTQDAQYMDSVITFVRDFLVQQTDCPEIYSSVTTKDKMTGENIFVYPNPAQEQLNVVVEDLESGTVKLFDMQGRVVYSNEVTNSFYQMNTAHINPGLYLLQIFDQKNKNALYTKRVQIIH